MKTDVITLNRKQLIRLDIINKANAGYITVADGAASLGVSERQFKRLKKKVRENGEASLIHQNSLKKPHNAFKESTYQQIITLFTSDVYENVNFKHFQELLLEHHQIDISYSSLYSLLTSNGFQSPKKRRRFKPHRRRKRKPQAGLLLQVDATPFPWFKNSKAKYSIHGAIDDATSTITSLYMCKNECMQGYFEMLRHTIQSFGVPVSIYADRHTIFRSPKADKLSIEDELAGISVKDTQFGRALSELNITLIPARSPQAKGRIERLWDTLQSRLPVEFAIHGITTIDAANEFLKKYPLKFNNMFSVQPENIDSSFSPLPESINLDYILCVKEPRTIDRGGVLSYYNRSFKIVDSPYSDLIPHNAKVQVFVSPKFGVKVQYKSYVFDTIRFIKPKKTIEKSQIQLPVKPSEDHCWRYEQSFPTKITDEYSNQEILSMLENIFLSKYA